MITDLALILVVASIVALVFKRLNQPLVLGYIVAGFLVSPHMPYLASVGHAENVDTWADIGVMFLMFALGLDFSFKKILKMGMSPIIAALTIIFCMMMLGFAVGQLSGWGRMDCIFLGGMLCMSSTTIIYKAFDDLGLQQQHFASLVLSVLILEDVLAIVMMVVLSTVAAGGNPDGGDMLMSIFKIVFFIVLWFVVGLFFIPRLLRAVRRLINDEILLVLALGLCCAMSVFSEKVGFSTVFGAFVMGSILAETVEAEKIERIVQPVKNLFGAIFFVSVGMLVDPAIIVEYKWSILSLVLTILIGQSIFGSMGFLLSGQTLKTAVRCGFSMAQIGEFSFIIASLGLSLGVISDFIYPVVVAVSVVTIFLTPYMIRLALPAYDFLETHLPKLWIKRINRLGTIYSNDAKEETLWHSLIKQIIVNTLIFTILSIAGVVLMLTFVAPLLQTVIPGVWADVVSCLATILLISPFLRAMIMKKMHSEEVKTLWTENPVNRLPIIFTVVVRVVIAVMIVFYVVQRLFYVTGALVFSLAFVAVIMMILSRRLKSRSIRMERIFLENLRSRDIAARVKGEKRPLYEGRLLDREIHIAEVTIPAESSWAGKSLQQLALGQRFGVHVSSILRGQHRINIPNGGTIIFPLDRMNVIGNDEQVAALSSAMRKELVPEDYDIEKHEMDLHQIKLSKSSPLVGKNLIQSNLRKKYGVMLVGMEQGQENLTQVDTKYVFQPGDILWVVGERDSIKEFTS